MLHSLNWISQIWRNFDKKLIIDSFNITGITSSDANSYHSALRHLLENNEIPITVLEDINGTEDLDDMFIYDDNDDDEIINDVEVEDDDDDEDEGKDIVGIENARGLITEPQNHIGEEIESESGSDAESLASLKRKHTDSV